MPLNSRDNDIKLGRIEGPSYTVRVVDGDLPTLPILHTHGKFQSAWFFCI